MNRPSAELCAKHNLDMPDQDGQHVMNQDGEQWYEIRAKRNGEWLVKFPMTLRWFKRVGPDQEWKPHWDHMKY